ncbi:MAG: hypothetical protein CMP58_03410, partial [Flavobacteriales bacterium]|nr:hypothetical protein [Flavobacteriales bacterium]
ICAKSLTHHGDGSRPIRILKPGTDAADFIPGSTLIDTTSETRSVLYTQVCMWHTEVDRGSDH